ncbi:hypothetical protein M5K25_009197 [Dendrobium thyrsiflorum]|uniref:DUF4283 domain-containing protein n=1 Tax=Dendrobium thyrsiflorum TaxID=117978 RepID=A0ABD0V4F8_DENTH
MAAIRVCDPGFLGGSMKSKSFVDDLVGSSALGGFAELKPSTFRGTPSLWISEDEILALAAPFQFALVVIKWSPSLDIGVESPVIPIWVSFPKLRPHLFSPRILHALGSIFGRPLKVNNATSMGSRASVVRVLVELDITKKYSDKAWLGPEKFGYIQMVEIEDFPSFCDSCKCIGHVRDGIPPPPVQPSQINGGVGMALGCGEADVVSIVGIQAGDLPLVTCGTELLSEPVRSTPLIVGAIALDNLVVTDFSTKTIDNLDPQSVGLDHPLNDMVEDTAASSSPNDNVVSDANQNVDGGNIDLCDANKVVLVESSSDLNAIIGVSPVTPHVEVGHIVHETFSHGSGKRPQLILDYIYSLTDIRLPTTRRKKNVALRYLIAYVLEKKYNLAHPDLPNTMPTYFTDASFLTLFHRDERDERNEIGEGAHAPAPAPEPQFYQKLIQRFECLESYFDQ